MAAFDMARMQAVFGDDLAFDDRGAATLTHSFGNEAFLKGHFPGFPVVPGVILLDGLILSGLHALRRQTGRPGEAAASVIFESVAFHRPVLPGMAARFIARLEDFDARRGRVSAKGSVMVEAARHVRASMTFLIPGAAAPPIDLNGGTTP